MFLPLGQRGDGWQFQRNDSINVISFRSQLSSWNVATSQLLLIALPKGSISKNKDDESKDTMHHIWKVLVSLEPGSNLLQQVPRDGPYGQGLAHWLMEGQDGRTSSQSSRV